MLPRLGVVNPFAAREHDFSIPLPHEVSINHLRVFVGVWPAHFTRYHTYFIGVAQTLSNFVKPMCLEDTGTAMSD